MQESSHGLIYAGICLEGLRENMTTLSQENWSLGWDLNPGVTDYETEMLTTQMWYLVVTM